MTWSPERSGIPSAIDATVAADLGSDQFVTWVEEQIAVEGPTAREAAFVHIRDDDAGDKMLYLYGRNEVGDAERRELHSRLLGHWDPTHDCNPWLATVRRQAAVTLIRDLGRDFTIAEVLGGNLVTGSPFRARALQRRGSPSVRTAERRDSISTAVWANVPWLPDTDAGLLAKIASSEDRVEELRSLTQRSLRQIEMSEIGVRAQAVADLADDLRRAGSTGRDLGKSRALDLGVGSALAVGSVLLGASLSPAIGVAAALAGMSSALPVLRNQHQDKRSAAYAFWMARPRS